MRSVQRVAELTGRLADPDGVVHLAEDGALNVTWCEQVQHNRANDNWIVWQTNELRKVPDRSRVTCVACLVGEAVRS